MRVRVFWETGGDPLYPFSWVEDNQVRNIPNIIGNGNENPATKTQTQTLKNYKTDVVGLLKHRDTGISGIPEN